MFLVTIGASNNAENIKNNIYSRFDFIKQEGFEIIYEDYFLDESCFIKCGVKDNIITRLTDKKMYEEFKFYIAQVLAEVIIDNWEVKLIKKIIKDSYFYLSEKEKNHVFSITQRLIQEEKNNQSEIFHKVTRKNKIMRNLLDYLSQNDTINLEGFVNFRSNEYIKELSGIVERSVELFIAEREYNEFIKLLKYFVDIQECKEDEIHIKQSAEGMYILLDGNRHKINNEYLDEIKAEVADDTVNYDDLLISTLITISPRRVIIHDIDSFKNRELVQTIKSVFADRVIICTGCELCANIQKPISEKEPAKQL